MRFATTLVLLALCAGCTTDSPDLEALVASKPAPAAAPTSRPQAHPPPFAYRSAHLRSPFAAPAQGEPPPVAEGPQGPLAGVPLDQLQLLGTLAGRGARFALLKGPSGTVHRLAAGDALGRDGGRIEAVGESSVRLVEVVRDGAGGWRRRVQTLTMQEAREETAEPTGAAT